MFIKVNQEEFLVSLQTVQKAASLNTTLPILTGVHIKTKDKQVELKATDLELTVISYCQAKVEEEGALVLPARLLTDIFKHLPAGLTEIETQDGVAEIRSKNSSFKIKSLSPEDYPETPQVESENKVSLSSKDLTVVLKQIIKSISKDESRPVLTGALLSFKDSTVEVVSTDSYRLALKKLTNLKIKNKDNQPFSVIVPLKALEEVQRQLKSDEYIEIVTDQSFIKFIFPHSVTISRLLDGQFPNYEQLISKEWLFNFTTSGEELANSINRVALIAQKNQTVKFLFKEKELELQAISQGIGEATEKLKVKTKGQKIPEIAFNAQYLLDGIQACLTDNSDQEVIFELNSSTSPGIIKTKGNNNFLYLVMPLRL